LTGRSAWGRRGRCAGIPIGAVRHADGGPIHLPDGAGGKYPARGHGRQPFMCRAPRFTSRTDAMENIRHAVGRRMRIDLPTSGALAVECGRVRDGYPRESGCSFTGWTSESRIEERPGGSRFASWCAAVAPERVSTCCENHWWMSLEERGGRRELVRASRRLGHASAVSRTGSPPPRMDLPVRRGARQQRGQSGLGRLRSQQQGGGGAESGSQRGSLALTRSCRASRAALRAPPRPRAGFHSSGLGPVPAARCPRRPAPAPRPPGSGR
jgi:hypothetical protein